MNKGLLRALLPVCCAVLLAGCGGDDKAASEPPEIDPAVAQKLADRSDAVAQRLDNFDTCGATQEAAKLRQELTAAINRGKLRRLSPESLDDLSAAVNELQGKIRPCENNRGKGDGDADEEEEEDDD